MRHQQHFPLRGQKRKQKTLIEAVDMVGRQGSEVGLEPHGNTLTFCSSCYAGGLTHKLLLLCKKYQVYHSWSGALRIEPLEASGASTSVISNKCWFGLHLLYNRTHFYVFGRTM